MKFREKGFLWPSVSDFWAIVACLHCIWAHGEAAHHGKIINKRIIHGGQEVGEGEPQSPLGGHVSSDFLQLVSTSHPLTSMS